MLREAGVEIKEGRQGKYFVAIKGIRKVFILAHESTMEAGWWGVLGDHISSLGRDADEAGIDGWGAALIHKDPRRGYWIAGDDILELIEIMPLESDTQGKYHLNCDLLDSQFELAPPFASIEKFLKLSRLND